MGVEKERNVSFSENIKLRRIELNMKLRDVSILTGLPPSYLYRLENGRKYHPSVQVVAKVAVVLELDLMFLINLILQEEKGEVDHG